MTQRKWQPYTKSPPITSILNTSNSTSLLYGEDENTRHRSGEMNLRLNGEYTYEVTIIEVTYGRGYIYSIQYHIVWCVKYRHKILVPTISENTEE